jgi:hypothetical protein
LAQQRIEKLERCVYHGDSQEGASQYDAQHDRGCGEREGKPARGGNGEVAARQRSVAFFRIEAIRVPVGDVIENVAGAR